jgi:DNA primase catalytic core
MTKRKLYEAKWRNCILLVFLRCLVLDTPIAYAFIRPGWIPRVINRIPGYCTLPTCVLSSSPSSRSTPDDVPSSNQGALGNAIDGGKERYSISSEEIDQLKDSVDIVSVVESYGLPRFTRNSNAGAQVICPFHEDRSPSMRVDNNRKIFKCFACGEGGDVFKFVRSYSALRGETMTFYESVRHVALKWGDPNLPFLERIVSGGQAWSPHKTQEERKAYETKKNRLLLCNAAAANFYGKALINLKAAGQARAHLRLRGLSPATVQTFALGYAPDAYFPQSQPTKSFWGEGSLVNYLRTLGFSAAEIVEAGLATETKRGSWKDIFVEDNPESKPADEFQCLMDRFRGRIIIPIFDERGDNVIAFGGRLLPSIGNTTAASSTEFKSPKYLNSPETPVFSKKRELFGLHYAKRAMEDVKKQSGDSGRPSARGTIVVVEGYMDTIALWEAGVPEVVASMGTALTFEQLDKAAKAFGTMGGRIIVCLDNDDAGNMAVERLCSSGILTHVCEKHVVEVLIATLPDRIKDPGEYFESKCGDGDAFRSDVLSSATEWSRWYTEKILSRYDSGAIQGGPCSFADICEQVSGFLASFKNPVDRTRRSYEVAVKLARVIAVEANSTSSSLQIQLESDLVNLVVRKAAAKEALERRVESVQGFGSQQNNTMIMKRMLDGGASASSVEASKLARNATQRNEPVGKIRVTKPRNTSNASSSYQRGSRTRLKRQGLQQEPLTPHFSGIDIRKSTDASWLGVPQEKSRRELHHLTLGAPSFDKRSRQMLVFFNSNEFHGDQFLTEEAANAGYRKGKIKKDAALVEKGIGVLIKVDHEKKAKRAEERLLRTLVQYPPARKAISAAVSTSDATGASPEIDWSSRERAWLFHFLISQSGDVPIGVAEDPESLWRFLSSRPDAPAGAFGANPIGSAVSADSVTSDVVKKPFTPLGDTIDIRRGALDASIEQYPKAQNVQSSSQIRTDNQDVDDWAASYDPTLFDDFEIPRDETAMLELTSMDVSANDFVHAEAVIDARLTSFDDEVAIGEAQDRLPGDSRGTLDEFFLEDEDVFANTYDKTVSRSFRAELGVQETLAYLLRSSAAAKLSNVNSNWLLASQLLDARLGGVDGGDMDVVCGIKELDSMNIGDLQLYCQSLMTRSHQLHDTVLQLDASATRIATRLMEYSRGDASEGRISVAKQEQLFREIDELMSELPDDCDPQETVQPVDSAARNGKPRLGLDRTPYNKELEDYQFQLDMEFIEKSWGVMNDNDYVWSMPDENSATGPERPEFRGLESIVEDESEESLEDALSRIDEEWGDWHMELSDFQNLRSAPASDSERERVDAQGDDDSIGISFGLEEDVDPDSQWE